MRYVVSTALSLVLVFAASASLPAQTSDPPKQTARQALIEMFLAKTQEDFVKHLPEDARKTLVHRGDTAEASWALRFAEIGKQLTTQSGGHLETFDEGPTILAMQQRDNHEKIEVTVEHDSLIGEADEIEVSIQYSKDGEPVSLPVVPRLVFTLQEEKEIWRLTEVTAAAHVPLTDPDYLKGLRRQQDEANQGMIQMRLSMILSAETAYAAKHPDRGYTCTMATLFTPEPQDDGDSPVVDPAQVNEDWNGYRFKLTGCDGSPASRYRLLASPADPDSESKAFCADQSGTVKFIVGEKASACFSSGEKLQSSASPLPID